jgi:hypothetical protein
MIFRIFLTAAVFLWGGGAGWAQLSRDARFEILRTVLAEQAAARIALPFGGEGVELSDAGQVDSEKLTREMEKNGQSIEIGKIVALTDIQFGDKSIEIELDGGGKNKKGILERIQVGMGGGRGEIGRPVGKTDQELEKAKGSKIVLRFADKVPAELTPDQLKQLLDPVLDFNKQNFMKTGIDSLPPEFREAVLAKEARIGMDRSTVMMALGRPHKRWRDYLGGARTLFVTFNEDYVVVKIKQY